MDGGECVPLSTHSPHDVASGSTDILPVWSHDRPIRPPRSHCEPFTLSALAPHVKRHGAFFLRRMSSSPRCPASHSLSAPLPPHWSRASPLLLVARGSAAGDTGPARAPAQQRVAGDPAGSRDPRPARPRSRLSTRDPPKSCKLALELAAETRRPLEDTHPQQRAARCRAAREFAPRVLATLRLRANLDGEQLIEGSRSCAISTAAACAACPTTRRSGSCRDRGRTHYAFVSVCDQHAPAADPDAQAPTPPATATWRGA
jgi:hypothetical protein